MELACQVMEVVAVVHRPSPVGVVEVVGVACLDRRIVVVVVVVVFRARGEVVVVHQTLQVAVEEEEVVGAEVGTG